jgi:plasminogen activator
MKSKKSIARNLGMVTVSLLLCSGAQVAMAASPTPVAPGKNFKPTTEQSSSPVSFSLEVGAGYLTGESNEMVYWPEMGNHKASELTWAIDNLYMVGIGASLKVKDWMAVNFSGWFKASDGEGSLDDYDWLALGSDWTDWSHSPNTDVTDGSIIDVNVEWFFYRMNPVAFKAILGYKRDNFGWMAYGGDYIYSENGFRDSTGSFPVNEAGIGYEQTFTSVYLGVGLAAKFSSIELNGRFIYSPWAQGEATDNHYMRNLVTYDEGDDGDLIAFDLTGSYSFTKQLSILLGYSYQKYDTMQGDTEWHENDYGTVTNYVNGAGMDQTSSLLSLALRYNF